MSAWFQATFGETIGLLILGVIALAIVCLLIWAFVKFGKSFSKGGFGRQNDLRLGVLEAAAVDTRRRLVLLKRDDVEHLIMIGGPNDLLIETIPGKTTPSEKAAPKMSATPERVAAVTKTAPSPEPSVEVTTETRSDDPENSTAPVPRI